MSMFVGFCRAVTLLGAVVAAFVLASLFAAGNSNSAVQEAAAAAIAVAIAVIPYVFTRTIAGFVPADDPLAQRQTIRIDRPDGANEDAWLRAQSGQAIVMERMEDGALAVQNSYGTLAVVASEQARDAALRLEQNGHPFALVTRASSRRVTIAFEYR